MPKLRSRRQPYTDDASRRNRQPRRGMMLPKPKTCIANTSKPPTASTTCAIVDEPTMPKSAASNRSPTPTASSTITHTHGTRIPYRPPRQKKSDPVWRVRLDARVRLEVRLAHVVGGHVRVHLRRLDTNVTE